MLDDEKNSMTPAKVLLVDDQVSNLCCLDEILNELNIQTLHATSGEMALHLVQEYEFAVILLDVNMPGMNGLEVAQILKNHIDTKNIPLIFVTGLSQQTNEILQAYRQGAVDYLQKPLESEIVRRKVQVFCDLFQRQQIIQQKNMQLDKLEEYVAIASHDLKTPLRSIKIYSTFLQEEHQHNLDSGGQRLLGKIDEMALQMESLIDKLIYFSRLERSQGPLPPVNLQELLAKVLQLLQPLLQLENVEVCLCNPLPTLPCEGNWVNEIFQNLIGNGIKYNVQIKKKIEIGSYSDPTGHEVFFVRDNGIGIPQQYLSRIFDMFTRLHDKDEYGGGTGAGLAIVKKMIERHHGNIWPQSQVGVGTTFYFTLEEGDTKCRV